MRKAIYSLQKQFIMGFTNLKQKPLWQMTGEEFLQLTADKTATESTQQIKVVDSTQSRHVYGILGLATLFGCSRQTANRIKKSGKIDRAITQIGRKIIVDAELALELAGRKTGGR